MMADVKQSPAIIIHSLEQARATLQAAHDLDTVPILLSPRGFAASMGAAVFQAMIDQASVDIPDVTFRAALDCADAPGHAMAALRAGVKAIVLEAHVEARGRVANIARENDCEIYDNSIYGDTDQAAPLDLLDHAEPYTACWDYLQSWHDSTHNPSDTEHPHECNIPTAPTRRRHRSR